MLQLLLILLALSNVVICQMSDCTSNYCNGVGICDYDSGICVYCDYGWKGDACDIIDEVLIEECGGQCDNGYCDSILLQSVIRGSQSTAGLMDAYASYGQTNYSDPKGQHWITVRMDRITVQMVALNTFIMPYTGGPGAVVPVITVELWNEQKLTGTCSDRRDASGFIRLRCDQVEANTVKMSFNESMMDLSVYGVEVYALPTCVCNYGFMGDLCDTADLCYDTTTSTTNMCSMDHEKPGTCDSNDGTCTCYDGYAGDQCATADLCYDPYIYDPYNRCSMQGDCDSDDGTCTCNDGYKGDLCDKTDLCYDTTTSTTNTCSVHGTCDSDDGTCTCNDGWEGDDCSEEASACTLSCNGGKECYFTENEQMNCKCPRGTYGRRCDNEPQCDITEKRNCKRLQRKNVERFDRKCDKAWGPKKCPITCGFCEEEGDHGP